MKKFILILIFLSLPSLCGAAVMHQAASGAHLNSASAAGALSWDHAVLPEANTILIVTTALQSGSGAVVTGVTFNGSALTRKASLNPFWAEEAGSGICCSPRRGLTGMRTGTSVHLN